MVWYGMDMDMDMDSCAARTGGRGIGGAPEIMADVIRRWHRKWGRGKRETGSVQRHGQGRQAVEIHLWIGCVAWIGLCKPGAPQPVEAYMYSCCCYTSTQGPIIITILFTRTLLKLFSPSPAADYGTIVAILVPCTPCWLGTWWVRTLQDGRGEQCTEGECVHPADQQQTWVSDMVW